jgi:hypothetical protein
MTQATLTISPAALRISEILDDACDKLHNTIAVIYGASVDGFGTSHQILERAVALDEFELTEIICNSMPYDFNSEDLSSMNESEIYRMCYNELIATV